MLLLRPGTGAIGSAQLTCALERVRCVSSHHVDLPFMALALVVGTTRRSRVFEFQEAFSDALPWPAICYLSNILK